MFSNVFLRRLCLLMCCAGLCWSPNLSAQALPSTVSPEMDVAVGYNTSRQNTVGGPHFWQQGGFVELSAEAWHGLGVTALVSGGTANNSSTGVQFDTVLAVFGPRYTFRHRRLALFGEGLIGEANAFHGVYPSPQETLSSTNSFASVVQGGVDIALNRRFALRVVQAGWQRTQLPNVTTNVQNALTVGAGICFRFKH